MAPLLATILVTCCAHAEDTSADGSLMSKAKPAAGTRKTESRQKGDHGDPPGGGSHPAPPPHAPTGPSWDTVCMLKDSSRPGSRSSSLRLEKALAIILLFLILLGWSSLCPVSLGTRRGHGDTHRDVATWNGARTTPGMAPGGSGTLPIWMGRTKGWGWNGMDAPYTPCSSPTTCCDPKTHQNGGREPGDNL